MGGTGRVKEAPQKEFGAFEREKVELKKAIDTLGFLTDPKLFEKMHGRDEVIKALSLIRKKLSEPSYDYNPYPIIDHLEKAVLAEASMHDKNLLSKETSDTLYHYRAAVAGMLPQVQKDLREIFVIEK